MRNLLLKVPFLTWYFQYFSLLLVFKSLTMMSLGINFFGLVLFGVNQFLESVYVFCQIWDNLRYYFVEYFSAPYSFSSCGTPMTSNAKSFVIVLRIPEILFFFSLFSLCCSYWIIHFILKFTDFFSLCHNIMLLSPSSDFFF